MSTKLRSLLSDLEGLRSREPQESKFNEWKGKVEKELEDTFGKQSSELAEFKRLRFFDFSKGRDKSAPLSESERREFLSGVSRARSSLTRFV